MGEEFIMSQEEYIDKIRTHLRQLVTTAGLPETDESLEALEKGWREKFDAFERQAADRNMEPVEELDAGDDRGALLMTYSGSLINLGPLKENGRYVEYRSIGIRNDVPESAESEETELTASVSVDEAAEFSNGPIKKSSPIYKIAVITEDMEEDEQEELLSEVTQALTEEFVEVNKTIIQA